MVPGLAIENSVCGLFRFQPVQTGTVASRFMGLSLANLEEVGMRWEI